LRGSCARARDKQQRAVFAFEDALKKGGLLWGEGEGKTVYRLVDFVVTVLGKKTRGDGPPLLW